MLTIMDSMVKDRGDRSWSERSRPSFVWNRERNLLGQQVSFALLKLLHKLVNSIVTNSEKTGLELIFLLQNSFLLIVFHGLAVHI
jgi:hypothetical protein